jgi:hypothetical protein
MYMDREAFQRAAAFTKVTSTGYFFAGWSGITAIASTSSR